MTHRLRAGTSFGEVVVCEYYASDVMSGGANDENRWGQGDNRHLCEESFDDEHAEAENTSKEYECEEGEESDVSNSEYSAEFEEVIDLNFLILTLPSRD